MVGLLYHYILLLDYDGTFLKPQMVVIFFYLAFQGCQCERLSMGQVFVDIFHSLSKIEMPNENLGRVSISCFYLLHT